MTGKTQMVLGGLFEANGYHSAAWLTAGAQDNAATDIDYFRKVVQTAERGKMDFFFWQTHLQPEPMIWIFGAVPPLYEHDGTDHASICHSRLYISYRTWRDGIDELL